MPTDIQGSQIFVSPAHKPRIAKWDTYIWAHWWEGKKNTLTLLLVILTLLPYLAFVFNSENELSRCISNDDTNSPLRDEYVETSSNIHRTSSVSHWINSIVILTNNNMNSSTRKFGSPRDRFVVSICWTSLYEGGEQRGCHRKRTTQVKRPGFYTQICHKAAAMP